MSSSTRIVKNTSLLYLRMFFIMIINLYTVRIVIHELGLEDYGIFNVIGGLVTMMNFLSAVMVTSTQRFYSVEMGRKDYSKISEIYTTSYKIFLLFSLIIIILGETLGYWFVNQHLNIPKLKLFEANILYQFSILTFIISLLKIPITAAVIANEDMGFYSIVSTIEYVLILVSAFALSLFCSNRLIYYGAFIFVIGLITFFIYYIWSRKRYPNCRIIKCKSKQLFKDILSFSGWTLFGSIAGIAMNQCNTILLNIFFGPVVSAARAIALQVNTAMNSLSHNFIMAIKSPIMKSYSSLNIPYTLKLFDFSNKFTYYSMLLLAIPLIFQMDKILWFWLDIKDAQSILFSRLMVIYGFIIALSQPITIIAQATGRVKLYHLVVESLTIICPFIAYLFLKMHYEAYVSFVIMIICILLAHILRLICLKTIFSPFKIKKYICCFLIPAIAVSIIDIIITYIFYIFVQGNFNNFISTCLSSTIFGLIFIWSIGLSKQEKELLISFVKQKKEVIQ